MTHSSFFFDRKLCATYTFFFFVVWQKIVCYAFYCVKPVLLCRWVWRVLQPRNIFLQGDTGQVKIGDFGLAKDYILSSGDTVISPSPVSDEGRRWEQVCSQVCGSLCVCMPIYVCVCLWTYASWKKCAASMWVSLCVCIPTYVCVWEGTQAKEKVFSQACVSPCVCIPTLRAWLRARTSSSSRISKMNRNDVRIFNSAVANAKFVGLFWPRFQCHL